MSKLGWIHTAFAVMAILFGAGVVMRPKGTRSHRTVGWLYVLNMLGLNVTALMIYRLFGGFGPFHVLALISLATVLAGMYFAIARPTKDWLAVHLKVMSWSYVGLLAAAASEVGTRVPAFRFWWVVLIATGIVVAIGTILIKRHQDPLLKRFGRLASERVPRKPYFSKG